MSERLRQGQVGGVGKGDTDRQSARDESRLNRQFDQLERKVPNVFSRFLVWLRRPKGWMVRFPLGLILIVGGVLAFLPVLGIWMLPLGFLLLAIDIPAIRGPVTRAIARGQQVVRRWWPRRRK